MQSCKGCRSTGSGGMGNSRGEGEDMLVEGLVRPMAAAEHLLGQTQGVAVQIGRLQWGELRWRGLAVVGRWVSPSRRHDPRHSCSRNL